MRHATTPRSMLLPVALIALAMVSVQIGAALAKGMFATVGALGTVALRVSLAAVMLVSVLRPWRTRRSAKSWRALVVYGVAVAGMNGFFYTSLRTIPLGVSTAIEFTGPLAVAILASHRAIDFVWVALAVGGLLALLPIGTSAGIDPVGASYAIAGGVCWALYIVFGRKVGTEHGLETTAIGMAIAAALVFPVGVADAGMALFSWRLLPTALAIALLSSAIPYTLEMYALPRVPAKTFGTLMSVEPAISAVVGLTILGEQLTARQWAGLGAIVLTSVGTTVTAAQGAEPAPQGTDPMVGDLGVNDEGDGVQA
ncbi:MAG: EamA family transporter [Gemmatimonadaceae bacterium]